MARTATPAPTPELPGWIRSLLPGILSDPGDEDRSRRDRIVDAAMYTIAFLLGALGLADTWAQHPGWLRVVDPALGLAALASLHWRRSHPAAVGIATAVVSIVFVATTGPALIALFNAAVRARGRALWLSSPLHPVSFGIPLLYTPADEFWIEVVLGFLASGVVVGWGLFVRARRELVQALRERTERVEVQTREAERQRIAREMHDVLAHRLSLLSVHAGALEFRPDAPAAEVGEAAGVIRRSAHAALEELREVIGVLRHEGGHGSLEPPQPTLADIPGLVEESRTAGMSVELELAVTGEPFPGGAGAHRPTGSCRRGSPTLASMRPVPRSTSRWPEPARA
jgi:hypothetical protein